MGFDMTVYEDVYAQALRKEVHLLLKLESRNEIMQMS
jgi:hypothetical protein